jgi:hypothetical protein
MSFITHFWQKSDLGEWGLRPPHQSCELKNSKAADVAAVSLGNSQPDISANGERV